MKIFVRDDLHTNYEMYCYSFRKICLKHFCGGSLQSKVMGGCRLHYNVIGWYIKTTIYYVIFSSRSDRDLLNLEHKLVTIIAQNDPNPYIQYSWQHTLINAEHLKGSAFNAEVLLYISLFSYSQIQWYREK